MFRRWVVGSSLAAVATAGALAAGAASALEKVAVRAEGIDEAVTWNRSSTCSIAYYNICTSWVWAWSFDPGERFGVEFGPVIACSDGGWWITDSYLYCITGSPSGYGMTGTLSIWPTVAGCPVGNAPIGEQPFLPGIRWNWLPWNYCGVHTTFAMMVEMSAAEDNPAIFATDAPAREIQPGVPSCGACYPETRTTHSWRWGTAESPLCPPEPFFDGVCNAELLAAVLGNVIDVEDVVISVESASWGQIKALYH